MASCLVVTAVLFVLITTVATIVCFSMPNWLHFVNKPDPLCQCLTTNCNCGLWINCMGGPATTGILDNCRWFFSDNFRIEKSLPGKDFINIKQLRQQQKRVGVVHF